MSGGFACVCENKKHLEPRDKNWRVTARCCNNSAFNGYHNTPSDYSAVRCLDCGNRWRTKARYVVTLKDARPGG